MRMVLVVLLVFMVPGFGGCKRASRGQEVAAKIRAANETLARSTKAGGEWTNEYMKAFNPQSRAQFPANRASLKASAEKVIKSLDEQQRLSKEAIQQYEQAQGMLSDAQQRKGMGLIISSLKKSLQSDDLFKSQMQLVSDESIVDEKTLNERFGRLAEEIGGIRRETQAELEEGRRLLGW